MFSQRRHWQQKSFICCCSLLLTLQWWHCQAVTDQVSSVLQRVKKLSKSLEKQSSTDMKLDNLQNCKFKQQSYKTFADFTENLNQFHSFIDYHKECTSIHTSGSTSSGIYPIWLNRGFQFTYVYCDMELVSTKKGWTTIQRRMNGEINFNRGWDDYVRGFGNPNSECWLGLENIIGLSRQATSADNVKLGVDLKDWDGIKQFVQFPTFYLSPKSFKYELNVKDFPRFSILNYWTPVTRSRFSTPDVDNDENKNGNCARDYKSGWWFSYCGKSNLNGPYPKYRQPMTWGNIYWGNWRKENENETALRFVSINLYHSKP
ncbi:fibrinogen-like protein 1 [Clavelina lepadiformis]|uniref:fibrinogen-like protein 1 n=1 Tax=Clavelina lepadiformis TaxID=159417 RepID=UPI004042DE60